MRDLSVDINNTGNALKPTKLKRHLQTAHPNLSDQASEYSAETLENFKKTKFGKCGAKLELSVKSLSVLRFITNFKRGS